MFNILFVIPLLFNFYNLSNIAKLEKNDNKKNKVLKIVQINYKTYLNSNKYRNSDFFNYVTNGQIDMVKQYIENGTDINYKDKYGFTALMIATFANNIPLVKFLLENKANVNCKLQNNNDNLNILFLFDRKIEIDIKRDNGNTAIMFAAMFNRVEIIRMLLDAGADIWLKNNNEKMFIDFLHEPARELALKAYNQYKKDLENKIFDSIKILNDIIKIAVSYLY